MNTGKDSRWFPHDANALDDPKIMLLVMQLGMEGYGLYWMLIEHLMKQPGYMLPTSMIEPLSRRFQVSKEKLETIVMKYGLFEEFEEYFLSPSLQRRMDVYDKKRDAARNSALMRWQYQRNAIAIPTQCDGNAKRKDKIREDKTIKDKKKEEKNIIPPSFEMVESFCKQRGTHIDPRQFFDFYESKGWKVGKERMKDWQAAIRTWEQRESKINPPEAPLTPEGPDILKFMYNKKGNG
jgi:hypothetical protein